MLYSFFRPITRFFLKAYFKKIFINGLENIPKEGPVILCSNHPTAFMEPCLLACFLPRELYFLVRADLFKKPLLSKILYGTNQLPIYRFRDGIKELRNSHQIINKTYENLSQGKVLLIFPEASTEEVRYLRPIKKGAARMAMEMMQQYPDLEIPIVPIGLNYSDPNKFRSVVSIQIGKAIEPALPKDEVKIPREIHTLTEKIRVSLSNLLIDLDDKNHSKLLDDLVYMHSSFKPRSSWPIVEWNASEYFKEQKHIAESVDKAKISEQAISEVGQIRQALDEHKFRYLAKSNGGPLQILIAGLLFIPMLIALLINAIPSIIGKFLEKKYVMVKEFHGSVLIAATMGVYIVLTPLLLIIGLIWGGWFGFLVLLVPLIGRLSLILFDYVSDVWLAIRQNSKLGKMQKAQLTAKAKLVLDEIESQMQEV